MVMDIFTMDPYYYGNREDKYFYYLPETTVQGWSSLIWTERYNDFGEFKMVHTDPKYVWGLMPPGTIIGCNASNEVMMVETHETKFTKDQGPVVEVTGRSILAMLNYRIICDKYFAYADKFDQGYGNLDEIGRELTVYNIGDYLAEIINNYGSSYGGHKHSDKEAELPIRAYNTISSTPKIEKHKEHVGVLWDGIKKLLADYHYGVRVDRIHTRLTRGEPNLFAIVVFEGRDLSKNIIFSEDNNTLISTTRLRTNKNFANKLWVTRKTQTDIFYDYFRGDDGAWYYNDGRGFTHRAWYMNASDNETGNLKALTPKVDAFFLEHHKKDILTGEVAPSNVYEYRRDYYIGDKVAFKSQDGSLTNMWVKEFIYSEDENGFKQYPTFESEQ